MSDFGKKQSNTVFFNLRKNEDVFGFWTKAKNEKGDWLFSDCYDFVRGEISDLKISSFDTKKGIQYVLQLFLKGETTNIKVEMNFNITTRSFLNTLLYFPVNGEGLKGRFISIEAYIDKRDEKETPKLKVRFDKNDEKTEWAFGLEDIPRIESIKNKKGVTVGIDDEDANAFFISKFNEIILPEFKAVSA